MSVTATLLPTWLALNGAIAIGALALLAIEKLAPMSAQSLLRLHYGVACALLVSVAAQALIPNQLLFGDRLPGIDLRSLAWNDGDLSSGAAGADPSSGASGVARLWIAIAWMLLASGVALVLRDLYRLRSLLRDCHPVRAIGGVRIWIHERVPTPLSFWRPGGAHVVLPAFLLQDIAALRIAAAHELQHHRQRDTRWLHVFAALRVVCALNPFMHLWAHSTRRIQEFACDEALTARRWSPETYASCLIDVADRMRGRQPSSAMTSCLIGFGDPKSLRRRMEKMFDEKRGPWADKRVRVTVAALCAVMTLGAHAGAAMTRDTTGSRAHNVWPVDGVVLAGFGKHRGIDIAAPVGASVRAYAAGKVLTIEGIKGCEGRVQIRHDSLVGTYCNVTGVAVTAGQDVDAGTIIGAVATPPAGVKSHLHFELSAETFIDPVTRLPRSSAN